MGPYLARRGIGSVAVIAGLLVFTFLATHYIGDPVELLINRELSSDADREAIRAAGGYDRPLLEQFAGYTGQVLRGDFGTSIWQNRPASDVVLERVPSSLLLGGLTLAFSCAVAIPLAVAGARASGRWPSAVVTTLAAALSSVTPFWLALTLIVLFAVRLSILPTSGTGDWTHVILPVLALSAQPIGRLTQVLQATLSQEMRNQYVQTARAKGVGERQVVSRHVLRNSAIVAVTLLGGLLITLINGAVLVEAIFAWPGLGDVSLEAVRRRDLPVLTAAVFFIGVGVTIVNFAVDIAYVALDPRVRLK